MEEGRAGDDDAYQGSGNWKHLCPHERYMYLLLDWRFLKELKLLLQCTFEIRGFGKRLISLIGDVVFA